MMRSKPSVVANRFTILHPEQVAAVACGSPGGWPIAPVTEYKGMPLRYPIGIADLRNLVGKDADLAAIRRVPMFLFLGEEDKNDSVVFRDGYDEQDERLIFELFGSTLQERWKVSEALYGSMGLQARFALYPGVGHDVTPEIFSDVTRFLSSNLR